MDQTSHPQTMYKDPPVALADQDQDQNQEKRTQEETDFILQVIQRAREEWEAFHLEHPGIDEETFLEALRFCLNQWFLHHGTTFADLPAFERAEEHFACELEQRADEIEASTHMLADPIFRQAQLLGVSIAVQARERSKQAREAIQDVKSQTYLAGKIQTLRAPQQTQQREQAAQQRLEEVKQDTHTLKALGITIVYENQKQALRQWEHRLREQMSMLVHLRQESQDAAGYLPRWEEHLKDIDLLMKDLHQQTLQTYRVRGAGDKVKKDEDATRQRAGQARALAETVQAFSRQIQENSQDALTRAQAEIVHERLAKQILERIRQRRAEIETWAQEELQQAEARKKTLKERRESYVNIMIKARNDVFGEHARYSVRSNAAEKPGSGYQRVHPRTRESDGLIVDTQVNDAADEAELESIYHQGKSVATALPDPTRPGTGAGLAAFRCAERFVHAKAIDRIIKTEEKLIHTIKQARSKTQESINRYKEIYTCFHEIKKIHLKIAERGVPLAKSLEKGKQALERAAQAAETSAREAHTGHAKARARELEAYAQAKTYAASALRSLQEISTDYRTVEETATGAIKHIADLLEGTLPFEQEVLDRALTGVKNSVKASMAVLRTEEQAKAAAHQTATSIKAGQSADTAPVMDHEHEVLLLAALANQALVGYATSYYIFHTLAEHVIREQLETSIDISTEQFAAALQMVKKDLNAIHQQKKSQQVQCQAEIPGDVLRHAHLLINERTGMLTLKDRRAAFYLQDLAGIEVGHGRDTQRAHGKSGPYDSRNELPGGRDTQRAHGKSGPYSNRRPAEAAAYTDEAPGEEHLGWSRLMFKAGDRCSSYDVPHELVHKGCEASTRIHLQVPDGAEGRRAMLLLPNGTHIKVADIDLGKTIYDPVRPECGVTITLKQDGLPLNGEWQINLLAAAWVMTRSLTPDVLRELMESHLDQSLQRLASALETKDIGVIAETFRHAKSYQMYRNHIEKYILSSQAQEKREHDGMEWTKAISHAVHDALVTLRKYGYETLSDEHDGKEITEETLLKKIFSSDDSDEMYRKRDACLQQIFSAKGLDTIMACELFQDPDDPSAGSYSNPTIQEVLLEYERATSWYRAEQRLEKHASDKWTRYRTRLRRAILDQAPAAIRAQFLFSEIREAVQADHWHEGTEEHPGVARLAHELEGIGEQDPQGDNAYANALRVLTGRSVAGVRDALTRGNPSDILSRLSFLDMISRTLYSTENLVGNALKPMTSTALAKEMLTRIGGGGDSDI